MVLNLNVWAPVTEKKAIFCLDLTDTLSAGIMVSRLEIMRGNLIIMPCVIPVLRIFNMLSPTQNRHIYFLHQL